ncbi:ClpXP protease specificity-enhancing factor [Nitrosomonas sp. HPC101]|uniref:ClpXP protease specificity-enhancing factor n=1 Tax=Nitrosomonas sp. HPC101 TaxID=1658667 RepID=UPI00136B9BCF|nr:ClpXP protease specificity-enhancing factor [Nitrosomonas sp. HPC101]MXS84905.1 ClpXP protease specificity-enhancing factor [Nitrosomonas sp. HPC101]
MNNAVSIKPYLIRAIHEWCIDNGYCPYISAFEDGCFGIPVELFENREIILNISSQSVNNLLINNETIQFITRFNGVPKEIRIVIGAVTAIFARESGQGLTFVPEINTELISESSADDSVLQENQALSVEGKQQDKTFLKIVK